MEWTACQRRRMLFVGYVSGGKSQVCPSVLTAEGTMGWEIVGFGIRGRESSGLLQARLGASNESRRGHDGGRGLDEEPVAKPLRLCMQGSCIRYPRCQSIDRRISLLLCSSMAADFWSSSHQLVCPLPLFRTHLMSANQANDGSWTALLSSKQEQRICVT